MDAEFPGSISAASARFGLTERVADEFLVMNDGFTVQCPWQCC